jgi:hypothetical protein
MIRVFFNEPGRDDDAPSTELQPTTTPNSDLASELLLNDNSCFPWLLGYTSNDPSLLLHSLETPLPDWPSPTYESDSEPVLGPIVTALSSLHHSLVSDDPTYTGTFDPSLAAQLFTRANREAFVAAYFRHTHKDLPLIHRPSFDVDTTAPALVLLVFLCGAQYCPPRDCVLALPRFLRIADEWVFREVQARLQQFLRAEGEGEGEDPVQVLGGNAEGRERALHETLQAALLMQGLIFVVNDPAGRKRNWVTRRPALVDAVRRLGLTRARHTQRGGGKPDWERFVRDEIRIRFASPCSSPYHFEMLLADRLGVHRLAIWPLLTDWHQAGVFHAPGLMTVYEMTGQLPCIEELWEANSAAEFDAVIAAKGNDCWRRSASLRDCMDALMGDAWSGVDGFPQRHLSMLDLQIFIFSEFTLTFHCRGRGWSDLPGSPPHDDRNSTVHVAAQDEHSCPDACDRPMAGAVACGHRQARQRAAAHERVVATFRGVLLAG